MPPHRYLLLSGVTPLSGVLHQLGGGVMLPNWCNVAQVQLGLRIGNGYVDRLRGSGYLNYLSACA